LAMGITGLLGLLRRRQLQRRRLGRAVPRLSEDLAATETAARATAEHAPGPWLDLALRSLGAQLRIRPGESTPQPIAVHLTVDDLVVTLGEPDPRAPKPWTTNPPGWRW